MIEAKNKLRIVIYASGMPFDGETVTKSSLGGSESAAYYMARELAARGHDVFCFTSKQSQSRTDGVTYVFHGMPSQQAPLGDAFEHYATTVPCDLMLIQRLPNAFHKRYNAKVCIWQLHDLALHRITGAVLTGLWQVDCITTVSQWHAEQVKEVWNVNPDVLRVVPNGVDGTLYHQSAPSTRVIRDEKNFGVERDAQHGVTTIRVPKQKFLLLFQSRPERGLENALELMGKAEAVGLPIHLLVCAYDNTMPDVAAYYNMLYTRANEMKNVTLLGALSKPELATLQQQCDLLLYPTKFEEVSCITAMEAMHAVLPMLTSDYAALPETCKNAGVILIPLKDNKVDLEAFDKKLQDLFGLAVHGKYPDELQELRVKQAEAAGSRTWKVATDRLLEVYDEMIDRRHKSLDGVVKNAIEHSDIMFAKHVMATYYGDGKNTTAITDKMYDELKNLYAFTESPEAYRAHYEKHQTIYYDDFEEKVIGEDVTHTTRYRGVRSMLANHAVKVGRPIRVLDYGCAHGHYTMRLAKDMPQCEFVGVDISERAVKAAKKWQNLDHQNNVDFMIGAQELLRSGELGQFDAVVAGEVLEHVWDYGQLLDDLRSVLAPDGCGIFTTPLGRWEHTGTVPFRTGREHVHHFDRTDIEEICAGHEVEILHAPAGHDTSGEALGSWVWVLYPKLGLPLSRVNYARKLAGYSGRQTVSACLIVKDGEQTLRRCVESFVDWVDEIIISIDPSTKDATWAIAEKLQADFPNRAFCIQKGVEAIVDGFAAARNRSIEAASGDWILWIDADEELRHPWNLHKLCRPSMHNGYGFAQVHYSVDPDQVLTVDYPCRLFRNKIGVKFYGYVHEHPEVEMGKAVPWSIARPEMKFLHHGYFDEQTRRKRFERNLPLLKRDVAAYPTERPLNQFLHLRDVAQGIQFDVERYGGNLPHHVDQARLGIQLMEGLLKHPQLKMITDSMQYYSLCVATLGIGFDANVSIQVRQPQAPDLAVSLNLQGRFHSREFYKNLVTKLNEESTKVYEQRYF